MYADVENKGLLKTGLYGDSSSSGASKWLIVLAIFAVALTLGMLTGYMVGNAKSKKIIVVQQEEAAEEEAQQPEVLEIEEEPEEDGKESEVEIEEPEEEKKRRASR